HVAHDLLRLLGIQRLHIAHEIAAARQIDLGLLVQTTMNRIVWPLEQAVLAVLDKLITERIGDRRTEWSQAAFGHNHTGANVVLSLNLRSGNEVLAKLERSPARLLQPDSQISSHQRAIAELQLVPRITVNDIDTKMVTPVLVNFRLREA